MVWNDTQWAAWMDDDIKAVRKELYAGMNFLGSADWAIDLQTSNDTSGSNSSSESTSCEISIDSSIWSDENPVVTAEPGCTIIWPPMPLSSTTTISFPEWTTRLTWWSTSTKTVTFDDSSTLVYHAHSSVVVPTVLSIAPGKSYIPIPDLRAKPTLTHFCSHNGCYSSVASSSFSRPDCSIPNKLGTSHPIPLVMSPTVGGTTTVFGGTTTAMSAFSFSSGNVTYATASWIDVYGGAPYCISGCPLCPSDTGNTSGGSSGGSDGGSGDDDDSSTSTSTSTETGNYETVGGLASAIAEDEFESATDAVTAYEALASADSAIFASIWAGWSTSSSNTAATTTGTATTKATGTIGTATATTTATDSSSTLGCYIYQDPDSGTGGSYCECPGYEDTLPQLTGSASPCSYTSLPTTTSKDATTTTTGATVPYPYTFTDLYGVVVVCESETSLNIAGYAITECAGSSTTEKEVTITVTEVVTTSAMSDLCTGGGYYACVLDVENFCLAACPKLPLAQKRCEDSVFENAQLLCETRCVQTSSTYTTTYATLAP
ncbi:hypothetical protein VN97_g12848 [Penicillium thymicola]|uniref:Uncharacterized protein n=1 Tax=Penicillium thymicola TaxID=293382 RepID=A0AAI9X1S1_PENTH|nr:hypothetical protein VN97_g12848 [Penicillium thymicola]